MNRIHNPIIKGFNPDPSILRVGQDYYLATSTFQWFPGVQIFHSRDLANWQLIDHGLKDQLRLNLVGVPDSGGVWAPSLSWHDGISHLVYTIVRTAAPGRAFKDTHNYIITAESIHGCWANDRRKADGRAKGAESQGSASRVRQKIRFGHHMERFGD